MLASGFKVPHLAPAESALAWIILPSRDRLVFHSPMISVIETAAKDFALAAPVKSPLGDALARAALGGHRFRA